MGYEVYITQADHWLDRDKDPILEGAWKRVVESDQTLQVSSEDYLERRGKDGSVERVHPVCWVTHPDSVPFWFVDGAIETKDPDEATIKKMVELAGKLGARVIGQDGEEYT